MAQRRARQVDRFANPPTAAEFEAWAARGREALAQLLRTAQTGTTPDPPHA
jgi:hypothetical protein